jgi:predicted ATPase/transcriptional regulator with XRE-family HTH domain
MAERTDRALVPPLRRERELRGWSQADVARRIGAPSPGHVSRWERGVVVPSPHYRQRFCRIYGRSAEELGFVVEAVAPPAAAAGDGGGLPVPPTALIGRESELAAAYRLITGASTRLLTLTGPPGVGKTRLALAVAAAARETVPDSAVFVSLASLPGPGLVGSAIRQALGLRVPGSADEMEVLTRHLSRLRILLVLDNFEHVLPAAALLAELLGACPDLRLLVTSRASLRVRGERVLPVPPLNVPGRRPVAPDLVANVAAVALFVERAQARLPAFAITAVNAAAVAEVCRQLDGLPLALELAAAWSDVLDPASLAVRLAHRLPMLESGPLDVPHRQRTMRRTLRWSYDLLDAAEQTVFRRQSVFAGGASLDAIEAMCRDAAGAGGVLPALAGLVDKHLVVREAGGAEPRFSMLGVMREYADELLASAGEKAAVSRAHFDHFASLVETAEPELLGRDQASWMSRLEREHDNIRAALQWSQAGDEGDAGLLMATRLWRFWDAHGHSHEGRTWLDELLSSVQGPTPQRRAMALCASGHMALRSGQYAHAVARYGESLRLFERAGDRSGQANVLNGLATIAMRQGHVERAVTLFEDCLAIHRAVDNRRAAGTVLDNLALAVKQQGEYGRAMELHQEALIIRRSAGDQLGVVMTLNNLSEVAFLRGEYERADEWLAESIPLCRALGAVRWLSFALTLSGRIASMRGDAVEADARLRESLLLDREIGDPLNTADTMESLAMLACRQERMERAARLLGAAAGVRDSMGIPQPATSRAACETVVAATCRALGPDGFRAAFDAGRRMSPEAAAGEAGSKPD